MKTCLVTGCNRGIGLAFVKFYLSQGWRVYGTARSHAQEIVDLGVHLLSLDCLDNQSLKHFADSLPLEPIDLLINNAGILERSSIDSVSPEEMHRVYQVNTGFLLTCSFPVAPLLVTQTLLSRLRLSTHPKVINITSRVGSLADNSSGGYISYRASKAALNMVTKNQSIELPDTLFLALHPGYISTGMVNFSGDMEPEEAVNRMTQVIDRLDKSMSGSFVHRDGHVLPF